MLISYLFAVFSYKLFNICLYGLGLGFWVIHTTFIAFLPWGTFEEMVLILEFMSSFSCKDTCNNSMV